MADFQPGLDKFTPLFLCKGTGSADMTGLILRKKHQMLQLFSLLKN